jgi:hypothetical protein
MTWWWIAEVRGPYRGTANRGQRRGTMKKHPNLSLAMLDMFGCMMEGYVFRSTRKRDAMRAMREPLNEQWQRIYRRDGFWEWTSEPWKPE